MYDDQHAAYEAVSLLIKKGHKKIATITGKVSSVHTRWRLTGYQESLYDHNIPYNPGYVVNGDWSRDSGYNATKKLIKQHVTAIFSHNDEMAMGVIDACNDAGIQVGKDIALIGFDNRELSTVCRPTLTTVGVEFYSAFGQGVSKGSNIGSTVNDDGSVTVWNIGNKGKLVPASTDGLSFYYTAVPANKNFTLTATATIDTWTFTNGQEGFGLMAADRVGVNGNAAVFWNNSYMASGSKVEYYYDTVNQEVTTDTSAAKITMKLGLGAQEKVGVEFYSKE